MKIQKRALYTLGALLPATLLQAAQVFTQDVVVQGSLGVGIDTNNGESFGFDTIRLKENNLRIHFDDTSGSASFPQNDWRLVANDTGNGGSNYLGIEDSTAGRIPFRVEAGAPAHALYVEADGDVGIKTDNPVVDLHVVEGNTPTLRLEQDGSDGFTAQTWDLAGNEANFFIRDVTNGSRLSFRIRPSAPESSIDIAADGDVGMGTGSPGAALHVRRANATADPLLTLENNGAVSLVMDNKSSASTWSSTVDNSGNMVMTQEGTNATYTFDGTGALAIDVPGGFGTQNIFNLDSSGNLTIRGALTDSSDMNLKEGFADVDAEEILEKVANIPMQYWRYKGEDVTHMGPMAQDFYAKFKLGQGETTISKPDADGVALAAIQALYKQSQSKDVEINELKSENELLEQRLQRLEKLMLESQK